VDFVKLPDPISIGVLQTLLYQVDRDVGNIDADPLSVESYGGVHRPSTAAKRVEHHTAGVGAG